MSMKRLSRLCFLPALLAAAAAQAVIPQPQTMEWGCGRVSADSVKFVRSADIAPEGYRLVATPAEGVVIEAADDAGEFYALQTLRQLADSTGTLPAVSITDAPRFGYRGMMIDVSRHFRSPEFIKKQIDAMARLKLNTLHLHLTDAAGWRLKIDRYPLLAGRAAWRLGNTWKEWDATGHRYASESDPEAYGGYYTRDDISDIVAYAAERHITVIPEIEMPSHSEEVLAVYPQLACPTAQGVASDFCPGSEETFEFLEGVLTEVMEMFPSKVIHVGGDEAPKTAWHTCPQCARRMADEGIDSVDGLQDYMMSRIGRFLADNGRTLMGWDEITDGNVELPDDALVMVWRGEQNGRGHNVVLTPGRYCYFDGYQDAPDGQPEAIGGYLPLRKVYSYEPDTVYDLNVRGIQGSLFAEYIPEDSHMEYMLYPRIFAIAERAWSPKERTDYADFANRTIALSNALRADGYTVFDIATEAGNRPESLTPDDHLAKGAKVTYNLPYWNRYPAGGEGALTDGVHGGWAYSDDLWQGFLNHMDVTLDLGQTVEATELSADFMQICGPWVWFPVEVSLSVSADGEQWSEPQLLTLEQNRTDKPTFHTFSFPLSTPARYYRLKASAPEPDGAVLFIDEISLK